MISSNSIKLAQNHVSVCICTFRRPTLLKKLLVELERQQTESCITFSAVVVDNDAGESARPVVADFVAASGMEVIYCVEPMQNIAVARNRAVENAKGNFVAFIDDDEFPVADWLLLLWRTCEEHRSAGVLGPVKPHFEEPPPRWIVKGGFCDRPAYPSGTVLTWNQCRTGNVIFRREILDGLSEPFRSEFGNGGEDVDFFMRMAQKGLVFRWCNEAVAYESVPAARLQRRYMLKRALLRGKNGLKIRTNRARLLLTSVVAVPVYSLVLLPTLIFGHHCFMRYCIKLCDHLGRLLAFAGINPVNER